MKKPTYYLTVFAVAAGLLYLPDLTTAQNTDRSEEIDTSRVYTLGEVIVSASRYEEDPRSVGRKVTVIDRQQIEESAHFSLGGLLAEQQSIHMIGGRQTPGSLQQGFIRNANNHHSVVMINGTRISDPSTVNNSVDLSEISLLGVERIEIVRGSHSTLYGSSAIGGVINIITQDAGEKGFNAELATGHGILDAGNYSTRNRFRTNYTLDNGIYLDAGVHQQWSHGLDATVDTVSGGTAFNANDRDSFQKLDLLGKVGYETSETDIYLSYRSQGQSSDLDQAAFNDDDNAKVDFNRGLLDYGAGYKFNDYLEVNVKGAYSSLSRDFENDSSVVDAQGNYDGTYVETNAEGTGWENSLTAVINWNYVRTIAGLERSVQTMSSRNYIYSRSSFGVFEQTVDLDSLDLKEEVNAAFIHADLNGGLLSETLEPFSMVLGGRLVHHNDFGTHTTYEINPKVRLSASALLYAALSSGYHAPSLYQLHSPEQGFGAFTSRGNPGLKPERSISYEVGWRQKLGQAGDVELSLFRTNVKDVIEYIYLWDGATPIENLTSGDYLGDTYINISRQEISGLELDVNLQLLPKLSIGGSISLSESRLHFNPEDIDEDYTGANHVQIYESGEFLDQKKELEGLTRRPEVTASLRASWQPARKLKLSAVSRFVGERDDVYYSASLGPFGAQDHRSVESYNLTDLQINYEWSERILVSARIENIFDSQYVEIEGYRTRGRGFFVNARYRLGRL